MGSKAHLLIVLAICLVITSEVAARNQRLPRIEDEGLPGIEVPPGIGSGLEIGGPLGIGGGGLLGTRGLLVIGGGGVLPEAEEPPGIGQKTSGNRRRRSTS